MRTKSAEVRARIAEGQRAGWARRRARKAEEAALAALEADSRPRVERLSPAIGPYGSALAGRPLGLFGVPR